MIAYIVRNFYRNFPNHVTGVFQFHTEKKDLIESKKIICLKDFLWFEKMIYLIKRKFL